MPDSISEALGIDFIMVCVLFIANTFSAMSDRLPGAWILCKKLCYAAKETTILRHSGFLNLVPQIQLRSGYIR